MNDRIAPVQSAIPLIGIVGWSGSGKTTLLERLLPLLREAGERCAVIKHAHHQFDIDQPGKDSHRLRSAGAAPMLVASGRRYAMMVETPGREEPDLVELVERVSDLAPTLILVEGFKHAPLAKLEVHRPALGKPLIATSDPWVIAVATPAPLGLPAGVENLQLDQPKALVDWLLGWRRGWPSNNAPRQTAEHPR